MLDYVTLIGFAMGAVAFLLSTVSVGLHWIKRAEHPDVAPLKSQIDSMQLTQADIIDRVEHWMKRDRVRKLREGAESSQQRNSSDEQPLQLAGLPPDPARVKEQLRQRARQMGVKT